MKVVRISYPLSADVRGGVPDGGQSMAIGDFDGVHLGHREVIGRATAAASRLGLPSAVMTFHPHPREVLGSPVYSTYITPLEGKLERFRELGVDTVYLVTFDLTLAALSPEAFVEEILKPLGAKSVAVGFNFSFGHRGIGTSAALRELGAGAFDVDIVEPFLVQGERVSSTLIRESLAFGDAARASKLLGRPFSVAGVVVPGDGRGRTIGVPTANLSVAEPYVKPANGVYAIRATIETGPEAGRRCGGVMNVGLKPTFHADLKEPTWEAHLFDYAGDLYGQRVTVQFVERIRDERKFESVQALIEQIGSDIEKAKGIVG
ncbi:bifunctional riboflavin kinase/FAD synthetase [Paenibacillus sp. TRM 82003]|nr:bifunctional riboflavin kinase/FAD synthetase [Paenibacillus sp. TRM 82003]